MVLTPKTCPQLVRTVSTRNTTSSVAKDQDPVVPAIIPSPAPWNMVVRGGLAVAPAAAQHPDRAPDRAATDAPVSRLPDRQLGRSRRACGGARRLRTGGGCPARRGEAYGGAVASEGMRLACRPPSWHRRRPRGGWRGPAVVVRKTCTAMPTCQRTRLDGSHGGARTERRGGQAFACRCEASPWCERISPEGHAHRPGRTVPLPPRSFRIHAAGSESCRGRSRGNLPRRVRNNAWIPRLRFGRTGLGQRAIALHQGACGACRFAGGMARR